MKYYDITFHELSGKNVIKRSVPSDKANFDACVAIDQEFLKILRRKLSRQKMSWQV